MIQSKSKVPEVHLAAEGLNWFHITIEGGRKDRTRQKDYGTLRPGDIEASDIEATTLRPGDIEARRH